MRRSMKPYHFVTFIFIFIMVNCTMYSCSYAQQQSRNQRPSRGSIRFGAESPPIQWNGENIEPFRDAFVKIANSVVPSVVSVIPTIIDTVVFYRNPFYRFFDEDDPFGFFFGPREERPEPERQERRIQGLGSGVIVSSDGYILTNYHVVAGAKEIEIRLADERIFPAEIAGADSLSDVAVIKITGDVPRDLPVAYLGNSDDLRPGDWVAAIGNPFSLTSTVTSGIVSALGRSIGGEITYQNFIQTDAAINPGNSGGALVNLNGAVMGINTIIYSRTGGFMGIGFAIPINLATRIMQDLIYEGKVIRGWIGVSIQNITPEVRQALGLETAQGALVADVFEGQPADRAGIRIGDVIISVGEEQIQNQNDLSNAIAAIRPGDKVPITLIREGRQMKVTVEVAERTPEVAQQGGSMQQEPRPRRGEVENKIGIGVQDITPELRSRLDIPQNVTGVIVTRIAPSVSDARATLRQGDIIVRAKVEGKEWTQIRSERDFARFVNRLKDGQSLVLQVRRNNQSFLVAFEIDR